MSTATTNPIGVSKEHITKTPGVCGGRACIAGHRIRVMDVVLYHEQRGYTPAQIADMFPGITLADVHAALAYYHDHRDEIEADFEIHRQASEFGKTQPSLLKEALAKHPELRDKYPELREKFDD
jgi:uncharacterized protein (DUF433 family)